MATKSSTAAAALFLATILLLAAASALAQAPAPAPGPSSSQCPPGLASGSLTLSRQTAVRLSIQPPAIQIQCICNAAGGVTSLARSILGVLRGFVGVSGFITVNSLNCTVQA